MLREERRGAEQRFKGFGSERKGLEVNGGPGRKGGLVVNY